MTYCIGLVYSLKPKLNYQDLLNRVRYVTKTKHDNDMIDRTCVVYTKNKIELSLSAKPSAVFDKSHTGQ